MAVFTFGAIGEFDSSVDDWNSYTERLEQYLMANEVGSPEKKRAVLLSSVGASTYKLIRNLTSPHPPGSRTYKEIIDLVRDHFNPKPSVIVQRLKFHTRTRLPGESVAAFMAQLRQLSEFCEFGDKLNEMLRDRLVCGINDSRIQRRLLSEPELTPKKAFELAQALETVDKDAREVMTSCHIDVQPTQVNVLQKKPNRSATPPTNGPVCYRCGNSHLATNCRFMDAICHFCKKRGHIAKVCRSKRNSVHSASLRSRRTAHNAHTIEVDDADRKTVPAPPVNMEEESSYFLFNLGSTHRCPPWMVEVSLNILGFQVDTGASISIISHSTYLSLWSIPPPMQVTNIDLKTFSGEKINVLGSITPKVSYNGQFWDLPLLVVEGDGPSLFGRNWLEHIKLNWKEIHFLHSKPLKLQSLLESYAGVFEPELGTFKDIKVDLHLKPDVTPRFCKGRSVPFVLREKIERELDRLTSEGIIQPVKTAKWAAPIVPVVKDDGTVRICGDYRLTVNQASLIDSYPLPRVEDLFTALSGGKRFTKLGEETKSLTTINTHRGLFQYNRLPFGLSSAPAVFQRTMDNLLKDLKHVTTYIDDILVTGSSEEEHLENLEKVLFRLSKAGGILRTPH